MHIRCTSKNIIYLYYMEIEEYENCDRIDFPFMEGVRLPVKEGEGCVRYILEGESLLWFNMQCTTSNIITIQNIDL